MKLIDINQTIQPPADAIFVRADVRQGWFVIVYQEAELMTEIFCNQNGREVFRVNYNRPMVGWWQWIKDTVKEAYANSDTSSQV